MVHGPVAIGRAKDYPTWIPVLLILVLATCPLTTSPTHDVAGPWPPLSCGRACGGPCALRVVGDVAAGVAWDNDSGRPSIGKAAQGPDELRGARITGVDPAALRLIPQSVPRSHGSIYLYHTYIMSPWGPRITRGQSKEEYRPTGDRASWTQSESGTSRPAAVPIGTVGDRSGSVHAQASEAAHGLRERRRAEAGNTDLTGPSKEGNSASGAAPMGDAAEIRLEPQQADLEEVDAVSPTDFAGHDARDDADAGGPGAEDEGDSPMDWADEQTGAELETARSWAVDVAGQWEGLKFASGQWVEQEETRPTLGLETRPRVGAGRTDAGAAAEDTEDAESQTTHRALLAAAGHAAPALAGLSPGPIPPGPRVCAREPSERAHSGPLTLVRIQLKHEMAMNVSEDVLKLAKGFMGWDWLFWPLCSSASCVGEHQFGERSGSRAFGLLSGGGRKGWGLRASLAGWGWTEEVGRTWRGRGGGGREEGEEEGEEWSVESARVRVMVVLIRFL